MSFNVSDFGPLSARLQEFADENGQIPVPGESWQDFKWPHERQKSFTHKDQGEHNWQDFVRQAHAAIEQAEVKLEDLEGSTEWFMGRPHHH